MATAGIIGTGFLYESGSAPVCCAPEWLAAYGIGLDSTLGDGQIQGVLREDQAEQQFYGMYKDQYEKFDAVALKGLNDQLKTFVKGLTGEVNLNDLFDDAAKDAPATANGKALKEIIADIDAATAGMGPLLTAFYGKDTVAAAEKEGGSIGAILARTVVSGYDVDDDGTEDLADGNGDQNGSNNLSISEGDRAQIGTQPAVSLGEIMQWSLETAALMDVFGKAKQGNETIGSFVQRTYTALSEGDQATVQAIATAAGITPEQLQVIASSMMNNHSNLMATAGTAEISGKNGAHEFLNNINDAYGGANDQGFQLLHIGNIGSGDMDDDANGDFGAGNTDGNDDLVQTAEDIAAATAARAAGDALDGGDNQAAIFTAGDNGQGTNGDFETTAFDAFAENYTTSLLDSSGGGLAEVAEASFNGGKGFDTALQSSVLRSMSAAGVGVGAEFADQNVNIAGQNYVISLQQSEDMEDVGYDVVIVTIKDPVTGLILGSMTATEDANGALVKYEDANGDGQADAVDATTGLSLEAFEADNVLNEAAVGLAETGTETEALATNTAVAAETETEGLGLGVAGLGGTPEVMPAYLLELANYLGISAETLGIGASLTEGLGEGTTEGGLLEATEGLFTAGETEATIDPLTGLPIAETEGLLDPTEGLLELGLGTETEAGGIDPLTGLPISLLETETEGLTLEGTETEAGAVDLREVLGVPTLELTNLTYEGQAAQEYGGVIFDTFGNIIGGAGLPIGMGFTVPLPGEVLPGILGDLVDDTVAAEVVLKVTLPNGQAGYWAKGQFYDVAGLPFGEPIKNASGKVTDPITGLEVPTEEATAVLEGAELVGGALGTALLSPSFEPSLLSSVTIEGELFYILNGQYYDGVTGNPVASDLGLVL